MKKKEGLLILATIIPGLSMSQTVIDFTQPLKTYTVVSDSTERTQGKSHGDFSYQAGIQEKKHFFFAFLDPQPNGAGFASIHIPLTLTLNPKQTLCLTAQGLQNKPSMFQLVINTSTSQREHFSYQQTFAVENKKTTFNFPFNRFLATYRGNNLSDAPPLDIGDIQSIGIRVVGRNKTPHQVLQKGLYGLALYHLSICQE
ncbi:MAG: CIA30 family protein [Legionellaceae bacterium]|nr:CIA30 family protein [Legionellaceae bacterium]